MSNILQWQPEKSRLWGNARLGNIERIREDLATLADWINNKANAAALATKADATKLADLEKALSETKVGVTALARELQGSSERLHQELTELVGRLEESGLERQLREIRELQSRVTRTLEQAETAARNAQQAEALTSEVSQSLTQKAEELGRAWETTRLELASVSDSVREDARRVTDSAQAAENAAAQCQSSAREMRELQQAAQAEHNQLTERLTTLARETETHAGTVAEQMRLATAASEAASALKAECETLIESMRLKAEELSSSMEGVHREVSTLAGTAAERALQATDSAAASQQALDRSQELQAAIQAGHTEIQRQSVHLEEKLQQAVQQVATSGDHLQACQRLHAQIVDKEGQIRALSQIVEKQVREGKDARDEALATQAQLAQDIATFRQECRTFFGRLKWLLAGSRGK